MTPSIQTGISPAVASVTSTNPLNVSTHPIFPIPILIQKGLERTQAIFNKALISSAKSGNTEKVSLLLAAQVPQRGGFNPNKKTVRKAMIGAIEGRHIRVLELLRDSPLMGKQQMPYPDLWKIVCKIPKEEFHTLIHAVIPNNRAEEVFLHVFKEPQPMQQASTPLSSNTISASASATPAAVAAPTTQEHVAQASSGFNET